MVITVMFTYSRESVAYLRCNMGDYIKACLDVSGICALAGWFMGILPGIATIITILVGLMHLYINWPKVVERYRNRGK
jgi:hypothetical protein